MDHKEDCSYGSDQSNYKRNCKKFKDKKTNGKDNHHGLMGDIIIVATKSVEPYNTCHHGWVMDTRTSFHAYYDVPEQHIQICEDGRQGNIGDCRH